LSEPAPCHELESASGGRVQRGIPFSRMTTIGCGGPAAYVVDVGSAGALAAVLEAARGCGLPRFVLGAGSNVLASDHGWEGVVIRLGGGLKECRRSGTALRCGAGASLPRVARMAWEEGLSGLETLEGIPGTLGGAVAMNAGAFGVCIGDHLQWAEVCLPDGERRMDAAELGLGYRSSSLPPGAVISRVSLLLAEGDRDAIRLSMRRYLSRREASQPRGVRTFGSTFRNPPEGPSAGELLDRAGCKGVGRGGAAVSPLHANFVINSGGATAADVVSVMDECRWRVFESFGVVLEPEVRLLGDIRLRKVAE